MDEESDDSENSDGDDDGEAAVEKLAGE